MGETSLALLNIYEFDHEGTTRHVVAFLDVVLAGSRGIDAASIVGDFVPGPGGGFDPQTFRLNPEFAASIVGYMNDVTARSPEIVAEAAAQPGEWLYLIDPRFEPPGDPDADPEPPAGEIVGCFAVDEAGQVVPASFQYNRNHALFDEVDGISGLLSDRKFYDWLHPRSKGGRDQPL